MTLRRVSIRAFALVVLCTATVSARPPQTTAFARRTSPAVMTNRSSPPAVPFTST